MSSKPKPPNWTPAEEAWLAQGIGRGGCSVARAAHALHRSPDAIRVRCKRLRIKRPIMRGRDGALTLRGLIDAMGLEGNHRTARGWIQTGLLKAEREPRGGAIPAYVVFPADLIDFLRRGVGYDPARIPRGSPYRVYATGVSPAAGYLTVKQAAKRLGFTVGSTRHIITGGRLPACHLKGPGIHPDEWWVRPEDAAAFRNVKGRQQDALRRVRAVMEADGIDPSVPLPRGYPAELAGHLGCSEATVGNAVRRWREERGIWLGSEKQWKRAA